jgi:hypothetical protein
MIVHRTSVIIIPSAVIPEGQAVISGQPTSIYPSVSAPVRFPISRNPIGIRIRSYCPITLYPNIFAIIIIPCPIAVNPNVVGAGSAYDRPFNG